MNIPPYLRKGSKIGIAAPARFALKVDIDAAVQTLESWGYKPVLASNIQLRYHQFAGDDNERARGLQELLDDPEIRAILCVRGGYGTFRIMEKLDFSGFIKAPKWLIGFSDITFLHAYINQTLGYETLHAPMAVNFHHDNSTSESLEYMKKALEGEKISYSIENNHPLNQTGEARGVILGGNLSVLYAVSGTKFDINTHDVILFLEDLDEYLYHIDRMMLSFYHSGKFDRLRGFIAGDFSQMHDNSIPFGKEIEAILTEKIPGGIPLCFGFPAGHVKHNLPLILGREVNFKVTKSHVTLTF